MAIVCRVAVIAVLLCWAIVQAAHAGGHRGQFRQPVQQFNQSCYSSPVLQSRTLQPVRRIEYQEVETTQLEPVRRRSIQPVERIDYQEFQNFSLPAQGLPVQQNYCAPSSAAFSLPAQGGVGFFKEKSKVKRVQSSGPVGLFRRR
jgi:hypothetical protein